MQVKQHLEAWLGWHVEREWRWLPYPWQQSEPPGQASYHPWRTHPEDAPFCLAACHLGPLH